MTGKNPDYVPISPFYTPMLTPKAIKRSDELDAINEVMSRDNVSKIGCYLSLDLLG
jgi:hypothetical protein